MRAGDPLLAATARVAAQLALPARRRGELLARFFQRLRLPGLEAVVDRERPATLALLEEIRLAAARLTMTRKEFMRPTGRLPGAAPSRSTFRPVL